MSESESLILLERWRTFGDEHAATELYRRYSDRLIGLARKRISSRLARRVEAEEIANSAARTFFLRIRDGRLVVEPGTDLWQLLAAITVKKVLGQIERHTATKRSVNSEESVKETGSISPHEAIVREPAVADVVALEEERELLLSRLPEHHRQVVRMRLMGHTAAEISQEVGVGERMVNIVLARFAENATKRLGENVPDLPDTPEGATSKVGPLS